MASALRRCLVRCPLRGEARRAAVRCQCAWTCVVERGTPSSRAGRALPLAGPRRSHPPHSTLGLGGAVQERLGCRSWDCCCACTLSPGAGWRQPCLSKNKICAPKGATHVTRLTSEPPADTHRSTQDAHAMRSTTQPPAASPTTVSSAPNTQRPRGLCGLRCQRHPAPPPVSAPIPARL